jgi:tRNA threonylcarbamoyl adenosine modification protein YjeE
VLVSSPDEMMRLGGSMAAGAKVGDVICLYGELGTGKTTFVRGFLRSLGHSDDVRSPTFTLLNLYPTVPPVCHADLYRLERASQIADVGLVDFLETHVVLIEWPGLAEPLLPARRTDVRIAFAGDLREVEVARLGE